MNAVSQKICSLIILSLSGFACSQPPAKVDASEIDSTLSANDDLTAETKVEDVAAVEPEKAPEVKVPAQTDSFTADQKLDLVIAVDDTVVNDRTVEVLSAQLNTFGKALSLGIDTQIHIMAGGPLLLPDLNAQKIGFIDQRVGATDIIGILGTLFANELAESYVDAAGEALAAPLEFRKGAKLEVVVFSSGNGEDEGNLAVDFDPNNALKANVSAVVALADSVESDECSIQAVGQEYIDLSKKLGGSQLDLCSADFSKVFATLANDMAKRSLSFKLSQKPADAKALSVSVNGKQLPQEAWFFDATANSVTFLNGSAVVSGAKIEVKY